MLTLLPVVAALSSAAPVHETTLMAGLGASGGATIGGPTFAIIATHRLSLLELGLQGDATALFGRMLGAGALVGLHLGESWSVRLLGAGGIRSYGGVGQAWLSDDPGASGSLPYLGGRLILGRSIAPRAASPGRVFLGLLGAIDEDLRRERKTVWYTATPWLFGGEPYRTSSTHTLGQTTWSAVLLVGIDVDLSAY